MKKSFTVKPLTGFCKKGKSIQFQCYTLRKVLLIVSYTKRKHFSRLAASITPENRLILVFKSKFLTYPILQDPSFTKTARISENTVDDFIVDAYKNSEQPV